MMKKNLGAIPTMLLAALMIACGTSGLVQAQSISAGEQIFAQCAACHEVSNVNGMGPGLQGIAGRRAGSVPGFQYSPALKRANLIWDNKNLDAYLTDPQKLIPGNLMPFSGIDDPQVRADLIAYLQTLK